MKQTTLTEQQKHNLNLGYCCINTRLRELGIFCSRTCRLNTLEQNGIGYSYKLAQNNLDDLACILRWNHKNNIRLYRMSSDMFPFASHPDYHEQYNFEQFKQTLQTLGRLAQRCEQRITFHPGQFNQLTSHRESVVEKTIIEINMHARIMDLMGIDDQGVIVIHGGSKHDGKDIALKRFRENFKRLSISAQQRLVLENCETSYSIEDLIPISKELQIPIVVDTHHHNINPGSGDVTLDDLISQALQVWDVRGIIPLFHVSQSKPGVTCADNITVRRAHSDFVTQIPRELLDVVRTRRLDIDVEAKCKERAVQKLFELYGLNIL